MSKKWAAWITSLSIIIGLYTMTVVIFKDTLNPAIVFATTIGALTTNTLCFIGGRVWASWIKSAHYVPEFDKT